MGCLSKDKVKNFNQTPLSFHTHPLLSETNMIHIHIIYIYISHQIREALHLLTKTLLIYIPQLSPTSLNPNQLHQPTSGAFLFLRAVKMADSFMRFSRSAPLKPAVRLAMSIKVMPSANFLFLNGRWGVGWWWWWHIVGGDDDIGRFWWVVLGGRWWLQLYLGVVAVVRCGDDSSWRWVQLLATQSSFQCHESPSWVAQTHSPWITTKTTVGFTDSGEKRVGE